MLVPEGLRAYAKKYESNRPLADSLNNLADTFEQMGEWKNTVRVKSEVLARLGDTGSSVPNLKELEQKRGRALAQGVVFRQQVFTREWAEAKSALENPKEAGIVVEPDTAEGWVQIHCERVGGIDFDKIPSSRVSGIWMYNFHDGYAPSVLEKYTALLCRDYAALGKFINENLEKGQIRNPVIFADLPMPADDAAWLGRSAKSENDKKLPSLRDHFAAMGVPFTHLRRSKDSIAVQVLNIMRNPGDQFSLFVFHNDGRRAVFSDGSYFQLKDIADFSEVPSSSGQFFVLTCPAKVPLGISDVVPLLESLAAGQKKSGLHFSTLFAACISLTGTNSSSETQISGAGEPATGGGDEPPAGNNGNRGGGDPRRGFYIAFHGGELTTFVVLSKRDDGEDSQASLKLPNTEKN